MLDRGLQPEIHALEPIHTPSPETVSLPNGIPLNIFRAEEAEVIRLDILIRGGQWNQTMPLQALFTNRMLREGSALYSSARIAERLDFYGAWLELSSSMHYSYLSLYSLSKYFEQTVEIVRSILMEPVFPQNEFDITIEKNKQSFIVNSQKVDVLARKALNRNLFGTEHPCGKFAMLEDYTRISPTDLRNFHRQHYHSGNCTLYLSGKVTPTIVRQLEQSFGSHSWGDVSGQTYNRDFQPYTTHEKRIEIPREEAVQSAIMMGRLTIGQQHPDFCKLRVLITLFGGYFGSRLMNNIREEKGYTYGIGAGLVNYPQCSLLMTTTQAANQYAEPIINEVYKEMERLRREPVSEEELNRVKSYMMGETRRGHEGLFSMADAYISLQSAGLDSSYLSLSQQAIIETTAKDILQLANRYLTDEPIKEVIAGGKR